MDYSFSSKLLHRTVLGNDFLMKALFNREADKYASEPGTVLENTHVFVSGLARAGTTALMRTLHETGEFVSLTYRDMPFVMAPNLWRSIRGEGKLSSELQERAHGDGLLVNEDSPEALDEVFWKVFCGKDYIFSDRLKPHDVHDETIVRFRRYLKLILENPASQAERYLSKNNNNILRIPALRKAFPQAVIVTPFRRPLDHALSLLAQHKRFTEQKTEKFTASYMKWLGHHEFGIHHRPFDFGKDESLFQGQHDSSSVNYWLRLWINYYQFALDKYSGDVSFLRYEAFCRQPAETMQRLSSKVGLSFDTSALKQYTPPPKEADNVDEGLLATAESLYEKLSDIAV